MSSPGFLSQEDVEALLASVCGPGAGDAQAEPCAEPRPYSLGVQERIVRGRLPALELVHERFARSLRKEIFKLIHRSAEISVGPVRVSKSSEFFRNLVVPSCINVMDNSGDVQGRSLIVFDPNFVFLAADNAFGGDGRFHTRLEGRDFTPTENILIDKFASAVAETFRKACKPVCEWRMRFRKREMNTQFAAIAAPSQIVVSAAFTVEFGGACADICLMTPYSDLEAAVPALSNPLHSEQPHPGAGIPPAGILCSIAAHAELAAIGARAVAELAPDDIFELPKRCALAACAAADPAVSDYAQVAEAKLLKPGEIRLRCLGKPSCGIRARRRPGGKSKAKKLKSNAIFEDPMTKAKAKAEPQTTQPGLPDALLDIQVSLRVELGRAKMSIGELEKLTRGSVISLDANAGDPLRIFANDKLVALGEVVVVNDRFGIRIIEIVR